MTTKQGCSCCAQALDEPRRRVIRIAAAGMVAMPWTLASANANTRPKRGDRLVEEDAEGAPTPLRLSDLKPGKPLLAFPFDATQKKPRDDSRLNKVVLVRFNEADLDADSKARAAGGVLAFSAMCTHQNCDVKTWLSKEQVLVCFCHSSKFALLDGAKVTAGPATRALPSLPLALEGDVIVVAGGFSAEPGGTA